MKTILIISLLILTIGCAQKDSDQLIGKWRFIRIHEHGAVYVSNNTKEQKEIIDRELAKNREMLAQMNMTEANYRQSMLADMKLMLKVTFEFKSDSAVTISSNNPQENNESKWDYVIIPKEKKLIIKEEARTIEYKYIFSEDKLILKDKDGKIEFEKVKAKN